MTDSYSKDLAIVHNQDFLFYIEKVLPLVQEELLQSLPVGSLVLDFACGGGQSTHELSKNYQVLGVDISFSMLQLAKESYPDSIFVQGSLWDFSLLDEIQANAVLCLGEGIHYLFEDNRNWESKLQELLLHWRSLLKKESLIIVDLMENPADFDSFMQDSKLTGSDYSLEIQKSFDGEILKRVILTKRQGRETKEIHSQRFVPHEHFLTECENLGLKIHKVIPLDRHELYFLKT